MRGPPVADETEDEWEYSAKSLVRVEMTRRNMSYGELASALAAIGVDENDRNLRNKIARGSFSAVFLLQCLAAIGVEHIKLEDVMWNHGPAPVKSSTRPPRG